MFIEKNLQLALVLSFITHSALFFPISALNQASKTKKEVKLSIKYIKPSPLKKGRPIAPLSKKEPLLFIPQNATTSAKSSPPAPFLDRDEIFKNAKPLAPKAPPANKPVLANDDVIAIRKKISLPPVDQDKIDNPSYISYYQLVREKIKRAAYQNYSRVDTGNVYISFVISSDGYLKNLILNNEKSCLNNYLKEIAERSVKDASPFPNFPKDLDYPQLSFNVIISFEIDN